MNPESGLVYFWLIYFTFFLQIALGPLGEKSEIRNVLNSELDKKISTVLALISLNARTFYKPQHLHLWQAVTWKATGPPFAYVGMEGLA